MLQKIYRLRKRKEFGYMYKKGQAKHNNALSLITTPTKLPNLKVGFAISKKVGKAVIRNKVKRQMREIFKQILPNVDSHYNYIFIAKDTIATLSFLDLKIQMINVLTKSGKYNE